MANENITVGQDPNVTGCGEPQIGAEGGMVLRLVD